MAILDTDEILVGVVDAMMDGGSRYYLEMLTAAYFQSTTIPPDQCALVEQEAKDGTLTYFFVPQTVSDQLRTLQKRVTELEEVLEAQRILHGRAND